MTERVAAKTQWAIAPGDVLTETLDERGMTQAELSRRMARPLKTISEIATAKAAITPDTALQLERALGISAAMWLALESRFREAQARAREDAEMQNHVVWLRAFPKDELFRRGILKRRDSEPQQAAALLSYFGVSSPSGWQQYWATAVANYRMSETLEASPYALSLWLREAEGRTVDAQLPRFDSDGLRALIPELRRLTTQLVVAGALEEARERLASVGVGLLIIESVRGAPASGAVRWIRGNPWILLTLRHRTDDHLWFSLFHEIGHLLEGGRRADTIERAAGDDVADSSHDDAANAFARDALLPDFEPDTYWLSESPTRSTIREVAAEYQVSPGIVVGRLERDGRVSPGQFRDLKRPVEPLS